MLSQQWHYHPQLSTTALLLLEEEVVAVAVTLANEPIAHGCFMLEVENGARNVTKLDGFVSLGKSSVTKKEF